MFSAVHVVYTYNRVVKKFANFCHFQKVSFPPSSSSVVTEFLCSIADSSESPRAQLKITGAALSHVYKGYGVYNVMDNEYVQLFITALIKSSTQRPMSKSSVLPVQPIRDLFLGWPKNDQLSVRQLRLKTITLLALTLMLRPSDIAPKAVKFDGTTLEQKQWIFSTDNVTFLPNGQGHPTNSSGYSNT